MKKAWDFLTTVFAVPIVLVSGLVSSIAGIRFKISVHVVISSLVFFNFILGAYIYVFTSMPFVPILIIGNIVILMFTDIDDIDTAMLGGVIIGLIEALIIAGVMVLLINMNTFKYNVEDRVTWILKDVEYAITNGDYNLVDTNDGIIEIVPPSDFYKLKKNNCKNVTRIDKIRSVVDFNKEFDKVVKTTFVCE
jgi:hypothetical protein